MSVCNVTPARACRTLPPTEFMPELRQFMTELFSSSPDLHEVINYLLLSHDLQLDIRIPFCLSFCKEAYDNRNSFIIDIDIKLHFFYCPEQTSGDGAYWEKLVFSQLFMNEIALSELKTKISVVFYTLCSSEATNYTVKMGHGLINAGPSHLNNVFLGVIVSSCNFRTTWIREKPIIFSFSAHWMLPFHWLEVSKFRPLGQPH